PMSEVYRSFTKQPRPARVPLGATRLPLNAPVEITMLAKRHKGKAILPPGMPPSDNYSRGYLVDGELYVAGIGSAKESVPERVAGPGEAGGRSGGDVDAGHGRGPGLPQRPQRLRSHEQGVPDILHGRQAAHAGDGGRGQVAGEPQDHDDLRRSEGQEVRRDGP